MIHLLTMSMGYNDHMFRDGKKTAMLQYTHLSILCHRTVKYSMHAQDGRLWRVDDGGAKERAKHPTIADGESATIHVFHRKSTGAGLLPKRYYAPLYIQVVHALDTADHWHHQPLHHNIT